MVSSSLVISLTVLLIVGISVRASAKKFYGSDAVRDTKGTSSTEGSVLNSDLKEQNIETTVSSDADKTTKLASTTTDRSSLPDSNNSSHGSENSQKMYSIHDWHMDDLLYVWTILPEVRSDGSIDPLIKKQFKIDLAVPGPSNDSMTKVLSFVRKEEGLVFEEFHNPEDFSIFSTSEPWPVNDKAEMIFFSIWRLQYGILLNVSTFGHSEWSETKTVKCLLSSSLSPSSGQAEMKLFSPNEFMKLDFSVIGANEQTIQDNSDSNKVTTV